MHWTLETPTEPGHYLVCTNSYSFEIVLLVCEGEGLKGLVSSFVFGGDGWRPLEEIVNCYRAPFRWCKIDHPPTIAELQANHQG